jgi:translation initiation factor IF-2
MSEGNIRINKVLRELNISLERAVDYLKDNGVAIEASPNAKISDDVYNILCDQFAGDKGKKEASIGISEEIRKEKEALRLEREKEVEDKRKLEEERLRNEVIKAKATVTGPKQVGKIDLEPKPVVPQEKPQAEIVKETSKPAKEIEKEVVKETPVQKVEVKTPEKEEKAPQKVIETPAEESHTTQYQSLTGPKITGQKIDLAQFQKPKKKKEEPKITPNKDGNSKPGGANNNANKNKRKRIPPKPGENKPGTAGATGGKFTPRTGGGSKS